MATHLYTHEKRKFSKFGYELNSKIKRAKDEKENRKTKAPKTRRKR